MPSAASSSPTAGAFSTPQLVEANGRYVMDLDALKAKLTPRTKVVFFCNPHNPGGTAWTPEEIRALAALCIEHNLILCSDEIHCDLMLGAARHTPTLTAAPEIADRLISSFAATKTFNLAGAHVGACVTSNPELKRRLDARILASGLASYNAFGMVGDGSRMAHRRRLARRAAALSHQKPRTARQAHRGRRPRRPLDAARFNLPRLGRFFRHRPDAARTWPPESRSRARIFASPGEQFGPGGASWLRFNFATPRSILEEALGRLDDAFSDLRGGR